MVIQDTVTSWDLNTMTDAHAPSGVTKLYMLFLLVTWIVAGLKLINGWKEAIRSRALEPPMRLTTVQKYLVDITSLQRWMWLTFLAWGACLSINLTNNLGRLQYDHLALEHPWALLHILVDCLIFSTMTLITVAFIFLARWYLSNRIERLSRRK
jgi:hypothetical protein